MYLKLLFGASPSKFYHVTEFSKILDEFDIESKVVLDLEICDGFPSRKISSWFSTDKKFKKVLNEFKPDVIMIDRQRHFGLASIKSDIPLLAHMRGDYWKEIEWAKQTIYKKFPKNIAIKKWEEIGNNVLSGSSSIIPICKYLEKRTKENYPKKNTYVLYQGIKIDDWYESKGMTLKHPCVGLVQSAKIWGKAKEMLILKQVLQKLPNVHFYWVGDGPYSKMIMDELKNFSNFHWLGSLSYPDKIREFLSEIDLYALVSGIDMSPLTVLEAQLMKKPIVTSDVGGVPELMKNNSTGLLYKQGNAEELFERISTILNDIEMQYKFRIEGRKFVENTFGWEKIVREFSSYLKSNF